MKQILYWISSLFCMAGLCVGCDADDSAVAEVKETAEVPVEFSLTSSGRDLTTRATALMPPEANVRDIFVDKVKVYTYKRPANQTYKNEMEGFVQADIVKLPATRVGVPGKEGQPRYVAKGKVPIESGYQYRISAVAYSEKQQEEPLFAMNRSFFSQAEIALLDPEEYKTPELFFGNVVATGSEKIDTVFNYDAVKDKQSMLSGWLYRGVAGIELQLKRVENNVKKIELLADSVNTRVKARLYDDFHTTYGKQKDGSFNHFLLGTWERGVDKMIQPNDSIRVTNMNLLEVCTSLSLRITMKGDKEGDPDKRVVCRVRVRPDDDKADTGKNEGTEGLQNAQLRSIPGDAGNGTGIIPDGEQTPIAPEEPDSESKNPYQICFKRNHYYILRGDYSELTTMKYVLQVTVNPNWDGDVYLPLDKSEKSDKGN